ncbi:MAG: hypothetical protein IPL46_28985 [Saprospiraceae bacterium]|nr:hypothetical protein [Saprospiraceae bacterium]
MLNYKNFQINWIILVSMLAGTLFLVFQLKNPDSKPIPSLILMLIELLFVLIPLIFYGLKTSIDDDEIRLRFGIGIIQIKIKLSDIQSVEVVRNPWYYGIGIRIIPHGILYNAYGLNAVELRFKNKRKIIRIGSAEPLILKHEIEKRLMPVSSES